MRTIHKIALGNKPGTPRNVDAPLGSQLLRADIDARGNMCLWFEVPDDHVDRAVRRTFVFYATGDELPMIGLTFVNTVFSETRVFVWHVYEVQS